MHLFSVSSAECHMYNHFFRIQFLTMYYMIGIWITDSVVKYRIDIIKKLKDRLSPNTCISTGTHTNAI
jgi:hypothetical protein